MVFHWGRVQLRDPLNLDVDDETLHFKMKIQIESFRKLIVLLCQFMIQLAHKD